jgi:hypothetical protein
MRKTLSKCLNLLIGVLVPWAWLSFAFRPGRHGALSAEGLQSLRYFTVLSNLLQGGVSIACLFRPDVGRWKYVSAVSVALTFFVVLLLLGPAYGYDSMYIGANLWFHLIIPILAMANFLIVDREGTFSLRDSLFTLIPMLAYSLFYVGNLLANGVRENDWYGFAKHGPQSAVAAFLIILGLNWIIALLMRLPRRRPACPAHRSPAH